LGHLINKYTPDYFSQETAGSEHERCLDFIKSIGLNLTGKDVLEIGYGNGKLIPLLLKEGIKSYYGADFSENAYNAAIKHVRDDKRVSLAVEEAKSLKDTMMFDFVLMNHTLEYIPIFEMEMVWTRIKKVLKPGGIIVVKTSLYDHSNQLDEVEKSQKKNGFDLQ
jgi:2-polyprenyl-3-methyl-5-hydroxy-6-metoxy-1,4-benzoquinol methylase